MEIGCLFFLASRTLYFSLLTFSENENRFAKEHMGDKGKNLSEKEELMMLFSLHDSNKDGKLDGIELRAAFSDFNQGAPESTLSLQQMVDMIDHVIAEDDTDNEYVYPSLFLV